MTADRALKECSKCGEKKPHAEFYWVRDNGNPRPRANCKRCENMRSREYHARNRERRSRQNVDWRRERYYGLTPERYDALLAQQGGVCAICQRPPGRRSLAVDHDHSCCPTPKRCCGKCVRGLLCSDCNAGLGMYRESPGLLRAAASYLEPP